MGVNESSDPPNSQVEVTKATIMTTDLTSQDLKPTLINAFIGEDHMEKLIVNMNYQDVLNEKVMGLTN
jgi:hypothetical protein